MSLNLLYYKSQVLIYSRWLPISYLHRVRRKGRKTNNIFLLSVSPFVHNFKLNHKNLKVFTYHLQFSRDLILFSALDLCF
jgi:hypothetical protein